MDHVTTALFGMADMDTRVSLERLDVDNYATWSVRMRFTLIARGLWRHVILNFPTENLEGGGGRMSEQSATASPTAAAPVPSRFTVNRQRLFSVEIEGVFTPINF